MYIKYKILKIENDIYTVAYCVSRLEPLDGLVKVPMNDSKKTAYIVKKSDSDWGTIYNGLAAKIRFNKEYKEIPLNEVRTIAFG